MSEWAKKLAARLEAIERRLDELDERTSDLRRVGPLKNDLRDRPNPKVMQEIIDDVRRARAEIEEEPR